QRAPASEVLTGQFMQIFKNLVPIFEEHSTMVRIPTRPKFNPCRLCQPECCWYGQPIFEVVHKVLPGHGCKPRFPAINLASERVTKFPRTSHVDRVVWHPPPFGAFALNSLWCR